MKVINETKRVKKKVCVYFLIFVRYSSCCHSVFVHQYIKHGNYKIILFKCEKSLFLQLCPVCPFQQGMKLNIIRFINGFKAHGSVFGLTGGDIYVTTFVPKPIKYHILHIPHHSILSWCFICDNINNTKLRKMLILTSLEKCWKREMYDVALGNKGDIEKISDCENMSDGYLY